MSKYKSKIYAEVLTDLILDKKNEESLKKIASGFIKILEKNGDIKKAKEIIVLAEMIFFKKTGQEKIILEVARKSKNNLLIEKSKNKIIEEKINPLLIAGIKVIVNNEKQLDFSLKSKLEQIF